MEVLIFYEHKAREYSICCALQAELRQRGISSAICHNDGSALWRYRLLSRPIISVGPSALLNQLGHEWTCLDNYTSFLRGAACCFINLQVEQIFSDGVMADYNIVQDKKWKQSIYYTCWGKKRQEQLLARGIPQEQISITGAPHLDFLRDPLSSCYSSKDEVARQYHIALEKRWILFVSSYTYADMAKEDAEWLAQVREGSNGHNNHFEIQSAIKSSTYSRNTTLDWIERYLKSCSDDIFIYRPHPGERLTEQLSRLVETFSGRFYIIADEPLQQWILVCDLIDIWISTAVIDVYFARKPCLIIQPIEPPAGFIPCTMDSSKAISDYDTFVQKHQFQMSFQDYEFPIHQSMVNAYYQQHTQPAYMQLCNLIEELLQTKKETQILNKFTLRTIFTKWYFRQVVMAFFIVTKVHLSRLSPIFRGSLKRMEEAILQNNDVFFTESERRLYARIYNIITLNKPEVSFKCHKS